MYQIPILSICSTATFAVEYKHRGCAIYREYTARIYVLKSYTMEEEDRQHFAFFFITIHGIKRGNWKKYI